MAGITAVLADQLQMVRVISYILRAQEQLDSSYLKLNFESMLT